jgi:hypothetical protein
MPGATYEVTDDELGKQLHQLLVIDKEPEVIIFHPTEGEQVVTRENYDSMLASLKEASDMTPKQREKKLKVLRRRMQIKFRTAMIKAKVYTVDIEDDANFGKDIDGNDIGIEGMVFTLTSDYSDDINVIENEMGCFIDEAMKKAPIRILKKTDQ